MLARRRSLIYPGGSKPGFDPSHPAAVGIVPGHGFSGISSGANFISLLGGKAGTITGSTAASIQGSVGPCLNSCAGNIDGSTVFSGNAAVADAAVTIACVMVLPALPSVASVFIMSSGSGGTGGCNLNVGVSGVLRCSDITTNNRSSGFNISAGVPYFIAASGNSSGTSFVAMRLDTGALLSSQVAGLSLSASDGNYVVGEWAGHDDGNSRFIAAAMYSPSLMSLPALLAWAADPWSLWYPYAGTMRPAFFSQPVAGGATTLTAATGTFTETGIAATFQIQDPEAVGAFAETGVAATTRINLAASSGAFTETGQAVTFLQATLLIAAAGSFAETGIAALFEQFLASAAGSFIETGFAAQLGAPALVMLVGSGAFVLTGFPAIELLSSGWRVWYGPGTQWSSTTKPNSNWTLEPPRVPWSQG